MVVKSVRIGMRLNETMKTMAKNRRNQCRKRGGFTLIEVLLVLFILAVLASMGIWAIQGARAQAFKREATAYVGMLRNVVDQYDADVSRPPDASNIGELIAALVSCPSGLENSWGGPYIHDTAKSIDPWGNPYQYAYPATRSPSATRNFEIWSFGPDGIDGNDDDITSCKQ